MQFFIAQFLYRLLYAVELNYSFYRIIYKYCMHIRRSLLRPV